jgi:hypothetical protein
MSDKKSTKEQYLRPYHVSIMGFFLWVGLMMMEVVAGGWGAVRADASLSDQIYYLFFRAELLFCLKGNHHFVDRST